MVSTKSAHLLPDNSLEALMASILLGNQSSFDGSTLTTLRANYERHKPMKIQYRLHKNFDEDKFIKDLQKLSFFNSKPITLKFHHLSVKQF